MFIVMVFLVPGMLIMCFSTLLVVTPSFYMAVITVVYVFVLTSS